MESFLLSPSQIERIIRRDTGIGPLAPSHLAWLQTLIKVAFKTKSSVFIIYTEQRQNTIYLMPTDEPEDSFKKNLKEANFMLKTMKDKTEFFASLTPYYKIKIVRALPLKVRNSESVNNGSETS
jgi:hypothetical protein